MAFEAIFIFLLCRRRNTSQKNKKRRQLFFVEVNLKKMKKKVMF